MTKLDKKILDTINKANVDCGMLINEGVVSQIKKVIREEILKNEIVSYKWLGWSKGYVEENFVRSSLIKDILD